MATWQKVITSGSVAILAEVTASAGFSGDGSGLTGISADSLANSLVDGNGIADFTFNGSAGATVALDLNGSTLNLGSSGVKVADQGITETQLHTSVAGAGLAGGNGTALSVGVDDSTVEISSDAVRVKDAGITMAKLANIATDTFIGRTASGTGVPTALTKTEALAILGASTVTQLNTSSSALQTNIDAKQDTLTFGIANGNAVDIDDADAANGDYAKFTANGLQGRSTAEVLSDIGAQASLTFGIANDNAVEIDDADATNGDYAKFTANGLQGRSTAEVLSDIGASTVTQLNTSSSALQTNIDAKQDTLTFGISNTNVLIANNSVADDDFLRVAGTSIEGRSASEVLSDIGAQASLTFGIANDNAVEIDDADAANGDYAKFTANGLQGRSASEVRSDLGIEAGATADQTATEIIGLLNSDLGGDFTIGNQSDDTATFSGDVTVTGDLIVNGDTTTLSTTNLSIEDKFITIASGSTSATDGGLVVSKQANGAGFGFGYDTATTRWVLDNDLAVAATGIVADAYVGTVEVSTSAPSAAPTYGGSSNGFGTMHVKTNTGDIYIYA